MTNELVDFLHDLQQDIALNASDEGHELGLAEAFTNYMVEVLSEAGEIDDAEVAHYVSIGARASGYSLSEDESTIWLFLTDYRTDITPQSLVGSELSGHFRRLIGFLEKTRGGLWRQLEESAASWDMTRRIEEVWAHVGEIRMVVLTNAVLRTTIPTSHDYEDRKLHYSVWDLTRLQQLKSSGRAQEPIFLDVEEIWGEPIPCLGPHGRGGLYDSYLVMLPGDFIATIYEAFGPRLLELNVRSFLQSRGKVNRGIQETIGTAPDRFLAYNNGMSLTAAGVTLVPLPSGGQGIKDISDLQIVNGGQTTASLHYAKVKNRIDLSAIWVQAKLSVIEPTMLGDLVPRISEYANSQNKVNMADFSANDPFHIEVERLSRTVWAPGRAGTSSMTRWFYERARGQYGDAHARVRTPSRQRQFKLFHPLGQKFTKTDLAKFENTWDQLPWIVSLGAEKNFREFTLRLGRRGATFTPDQTYFEALIAKIILFRSSERLIGALNLGGYRAQTVTYTVSKLLNSVGQRLDLRAIWHRQELSPAIASAIQDLGPRVHARLLSSAGSRNISEWAKREECWKAIQDLAWTPSLELRSELTGAVSRTSTTSSASVAEQLNASERDALEVVLDLPGESWKALSYWAKEADALLPWERSLAFGLGRLLTAGRIPSRKQVVQGARILTEAQRIGFSPAVEP